ncbi:MAG: hypothetical protein ACI4AA_05915 [Lachnospiraceae bacterium]
MKIHYFQRYNEKENVATANTMLLLSRLYSYSSDKFFRFLKSEFFSDSFSPEIIFTLQEKSVESVPDATIKQESFKIVVETKMSDWFYEDQLIRHLKSFNDEKYKVMITLAPEHMAEDKKKKFEEKLKEYNGQQTHPVIHINTTFEELANAISDVLDDRDYEIQDVLDDYLNYCYTDGLIPVSDSWKYMRMQLAGTTFDFNMKANVYYDNAERGFRAHDTLALYKNKSVRAIGKIIARITAVKTENGVKYNAEFGELTEERKAVIESAMEDGDSHGYDLRTIEHRYFFVEKFYETDFKKITPRAPMGTRIFDLTKVLGTDHIPATERLAELLRNETWT